jgi:class 3 adenylate cyclase/tetratricopeptide (TPR) repeat protein
MALIENITVLFTDLVGSTELASSLTPDAGDEVRRGHFSVLRQAIAEMGGTEVKNLGDGIMVVFPSTSAALSCAVAMQQGVDQDNRDLDRPLGLRVGLSIGEATREADDYFGDPVIEAARLCAKSDGGQILAADAVRVMAGRRARQEFRSLGELTLKGLPDPMETVEVLWEPLGAIEAEVTVPLPARLAVRPGPGVVGRENELALIADAAKRVAADQGREVLLVSGEAGLGKTTLVAESCRSAFDSGAVVLFGHCEEDLATPYQLFAEALGYYVTHAPEDQLLAHIAAHGSELEKLTPVLASRIPDLPPSKATDTDTERFLHFSAVVGLLAQVSTDQPVVLVLDDLHWANKGSLLLLRRLVASDQAMRVLVLGTYRDNELSQSDALVETLAVLRRQTGVSRIDLTGLDDTGVLALLEVTAGYTLDDAGVGLAHAVYRETDGNPYFVTEVLRHLAETGAIYPDDTGRWVADVDLDQLALPDSVREVIGARVVRLGPDAGRVLATAAVIGRDFDLDVLARATQTAEDDLLDMLEAAAAAALVREPTDASGRYSFAHALIQHTLFEDLGPNRRARAHRKVAEALEDLCGDQPGARLGALARHWTSATQPFDVTKAISYNQKAGDAALAALAPADALGYYAQALDLYPQATEPDSVLALDLAIGLGTAQRQTGDPAFRETLLDAARRATDLDDTNRLVAAVLANNRGLFTQVGVTDADKFEVLELTLDRLTPRDPDRALVLATLCSELTFGSPLERRQALADEAIAIAEGSGDDALVVRVLNHVHLPLHVPPLLDQALAWTSDALVRAKSLGDPALLFRAAAWRMDVATHAGDIDEVDRCLDIEASLVRQLAEPTLNWIHVFGRSMRAQIAGDTDRAEQLATEALQIATDSGQPDASVFFGGQMMVVNAQRGTLGDLVPQIEEMAASAPEVGGPLFPVLALAHAQAGHFDEARRLLEDFSSTGFDLPMDSTWLSGMTNYAEAAIECRDPRYAEPLFNRLYPWVDRLSGIGGLTVGGPVSYYLGGLAAVLGRHHEADGYFTQSAAMSAGVGAKFFAAVTGLRWGQMLADRHAPGDLDKALDLLINAHTAAGKHGYGYVERRTAEVLNQLVA